MHVERAVKLSLLQTELISLGRELWCDTKPAWTGLVKHRTQQGVNIFKIPLKSEVGHRVWKDDSQGGRVTSLTVLRLLNHWTDGLVQYKPSIALPKQGVPDICTENCTHQSVLCYPDAHNFGNSETNLLFKQRKNAFFFFLVFSWVFFPLTFMATWLSAAEMISGGRKLFCICMTVSSVCYRLGRHCPAPPSIYLSNSGKCLEWSHPDPFTPKYPGACLQHCSLALKTILQQHKVHETDQVQQWKPGIPRKGRESALKLQITSWRRIFRNGMALGRYFSILTISVAISLTTVPSYSKHWLCFLTQRSLSVKLVNFFKVWGTLRAVMFDW